MTATEFQRRLRQLAVREAMTFATFNALDAETMVADARRTDGARRGPFERRYRRQSAPANRFPSGSPCCSPPPVRPDATARTTRCGGIGFPAVPIIRTPAVRPNILYPSV